MCGRMLACGTELSLEATCTTQKGKEHPLEVRSLQSKRQSKSLSLTMRLLRRSMRILGHITVNVPFDSK